MSLYFQKIYKIKKFIFEVDKEWFARYYNFITNIKNKNGFNPIRVIQNPNINIIHILKDPILVKYLDEFVSSSQMSSQIIESMFQVNWDIYRLSPESYISISFILKKMKTHKFNWHNISSNKYINMNDIHIYKIIPWDYKGISLNPNLDIYHINKFYQEGRSLDWMAISMHRKVLMKDIQNNPKLPWDMDGISQNPNITNNFIRSNSSWKWNYTLLSKNPGIRLRFVFKNLDKPWNWTYLSSHPRLNLNIIKKYPNQKWNWYKISANPSFTIQIKKKNPEFPWCYKGFSCNPTLNMVYVVKNLDKKWDFECICKNLFISDRFKFYELKLQQYFMAQKIILFWKKQSQNLNCAIGRKINSLRYNDLQDEHEQMYIDDEEAQKALGITNHQKIVNLYKK